MQGILCLFVPFYILYFAFARMVTNKKGLLVGAWIGTFLAGPVLQYVGPSLLKNDACKLATTAEVGAVLGEPMMNSTAEAQGLTPFGVIDCCAYGTAHIPQKFIVIALERKCDSLEEVRKAAATQLMPVVGVGDEAYFGGSELTARNGHSCIYIKITDENRRGGLSGYDKMNFAKAVAEKVLERLP